MNKNIISTIIVVLIIIGGVYWFNSSKKVVDTTNESPVVNSGENTSQPGATMPGLPAEPAATEARKDLALKLNTDENNILIMQVVEVTWNDGCLGLGRADEGCMQALVPGFKVELFAKGKLYIYRTDKTGSSLRAETAI
ncbi:MAG: hypothetical protein V4690_02590 [Patescibacteria group bacterium]